MTVSPQTDLLVRGSDVALVYAIAAKSALSLTRCGPIPVKRELLRSQNSTLVTSVLVTLRVTTVPVGTGKGEYECAHHRQTLAAPGE